VRGFFRFLNFGLVSIFSTITFISGDSMDEALKKQCNRNHSFPVDRDIK
jgi:hypothetical protein